MADWHDRLAADLERRREARGMQDASVLLVGSAAASAPHSSPRDVDLILVAPTITSSMRAAVADSARLIVPGVPHSVHPIPRAELPRAAHYDGFRIRDYQSSTRVLLGHNELKDLTPSLTRASLDASLAVQVLCWTVLAEQRRLPLSLSRSKIAHQVERDAELWGRTAHFTWKAFAGAPLGARLLGAIRSGSSTRLSGTTRAVLHRVRHENMYRGPQYRRAVRDVAITRLAERLAWNSL